MKKLRTVEEENKIREDSEVVSCAVTWEPPKIIGWEETAIASGFGGEILKAIYGTGFTQAMLRDYIVIKCSKTKKKGKMFEKGIRGVIDSIKWDDGSKGYASWEDNK